MFFFWFRVSSRCWGFRRVDVVLYFFNVFPFVWIMNVIQKIQFLVVGKKKREISTIQLAIS